MKREILFRGQRKNKEWMFGDLLEYNGKTQIIQHHFNGEWSIERNNVVPETVGQFTGMFDKNGTRIFEGDIVTAKSKFFNDSEHNGSIEMNEFRASWSIKFGSCVNNDLFRYVQNGGQCEVVGNIHDVKEQPVNEAT